MKKKFFYFLLLALPALCFVSCSDDGEDLPDVDFSLEFEGFPHRSLLRNI